MYICACNYNELPWIFPRAPLISNGAPEKVHGNIGGYVYYPKHGKTDAKSFVLHIVSFLYVAPQY